MRYRTFGRLGWQVSEIGYGTWGMGGWSGSDDEESHAALDRSVALGCNFFDTALAYGGGKSEQMVGEMLRRHPGRPLLVATKVPPKDLVWPGRASTPVSATYPASHIRASTEISLRNLGVERIDLQQLHVWSDAWADDDGWKREAERLKADGLIGGFGISINRWQPQSVLRAIETGLIDAVQVVYNIFDQAPEDALFPACRARGVAVIARVPFDEGSLAGALGPGSTWPEGDWRNSYFGAENLRATLERVAALEQDLPDGASLPDEALRFILANEDVSTIIPGMRRRRHVESNLAISAAPTMTSEMVRMLRKHRWDRG
ncbi:MAG: aldo/keto reductase, partial [Acidobacteriota bacterium]|nr:aldo/keto reductase [Acidobacteriota bacterium]